jgi:hypothetical protein
MATVNEECTTKEQCSAAPFLEAKGLNAKNIHKEMFCSLQWEVFVA